MRFRILLQSLKGLRKTLRNIKKNIEKQHTHGNIIQNINDIDSKIAIIFPLLETLPDQIEKMLLTNNEMKNGSEPDNTADYWEERTKITSNITNLIIPNVSACLFIAFQRCFYAFSMLCIAFSMLFGVLLCCSLFFNIV